MIKNVSKLEIYVDNRIYELYCDSNSPLKDLKEALFQFQKYVGNIEDQAINDSKAKEAYEKILADPELAPEEKAIVDDAPLKETPQ